MTSNVLTWGLFYVKWNQVVTEFASGEEKAKFKLKKKKINKLLTELCCKLEKKERKKKKLQYFMCYKCRDRV